MIPGIGAQGHLIDLESATDLSFPIAAEHFRWRHEREVVESLAAGAPFESTRFAMSAHAFTHADAPAHIRTGAATLNSVPVRTWVGTATVVDVSSTPDGGAITADALQLAAPPLPSREIILLRTDWNLRRRIETRSYWSEAPWVDPSAAEWLYDRAPRAVGFDFPQDAAIRRALEGEQPAPTEFITHDLLLRRGVGLIEYLRGLASLATRVLLVAAPIALPDSDVGPVRAIAFDLLQRPAPETISPQEGNRDLPS